MKTIFKHTLLSLVLLTGTFTAQAQVKIGSSPTTIGANSNLEVQAANGKKVIVEKTVGTVQVENLPPGVATNKIVTADPTGVLQQVDASILPNSLFPFSVMSYNLESYTAPEQLGEVQKRIINYDYVAYDPQGAADITTNRFTIKKTGFYAMHIAGFIRAAGTAQITILKNPPAISAPNYFSSQIAYGSIGAPTQNTLLDFTRYAYLTAGDQLETAFSTCGGCYGDQIYILSNATFAIQFVGN